LNGKSELELALKRENVWHAENHNGENYQGITSFEELGDLTCKIEANLQQQRRRERYYSFKKGEEKTADRLITIGRMFIIRLEEKKF